jgi:hypothetical protein
VAVLDKTIATEEGVGEVPGHFTSPAAALRLRAGRNEVHGQLPVCTALWQGARGQARHQERADPVVKTVPDIRAAPDAAV